jgi:2'-5' RNA ligase
VKPANRARTKSKTALTYWLVPARPQRDLFAEMIRILAAQLKAFPFEPHLTICSGPDSKVVRDALKKISGVGGIRLRVKEITASNKLTKTLFIRFTRARALDELNRKLRRAAQLPPRALRDPHVSLLYNKMSLAAKKELAATIRLPFEKVSFDTIKVVRSKTPMRTSADVKSWRVVATKNLSG